MYMVFSLKSYPHNDESILVSGDGVYFSYNNVSLFPMQAVATAAPSLTAVGDNRGNQVWSDFGSLARYEITIFEANIPSNTWKILGHHAQGNWEGLKTAIHAFRYIHTYWQYEGSKSVHDTLRLKYSKRPIY